MFLRKIIDIKISNNEISVMREAKVSVHELEAQIEKIVYSGESLPKIVGAENAKLPAFIQVFLLLIF